LADAVAEVKRMYVPDRWRGAHLGSAILDRLIDQAAAAGATAVRLDTVRFMTDAQRLYRSRGFTECPAYEETEIPSRLRQHWLFFERRL
jgi:GNAT superfamily N-acetyltransferase